MSITHKQAFAMAAIVLAGLLAGGAVLLAGGHTAAEEHGQAEEHGKEHGEEHGKAPGKEGENAHDDKAGHAEEQRITLTETQQNTSGITTQTVAPGTLQSSTQFQGEIRFNEDRKAHVVPRLAGVVQHVAVTLGQQVQRGQVLASIASTALAEQRSELLTAQRRRALAQTTYEREKQLWQAKISAAQDHLQAEAALQEADIAVRNAQQKLAAVGAAASASELNRFELRAPFSGTVVEKHIALGEAVKEDASIFTIADLSSVWAEFAVAPKDLASVRVGQQVMLSSSAFDGQVAGTVSYVGALLGEQTRTARARVVLANPGGAWRPGLFVTVAVLGPATAVPLVVSADTLQDINNQPTVFVAVPGGFVARPVQTGRSDGKTVEILQGLQAGDKVAAANSFVLKSELGKASAEHGH